MEEENQENQKQVIETKKIQLENRLKSIEYVTNIRQVINLQQMSFQYNEKNDIIKNVYEGGFKLWECTLDLLQEGQNIFQDKNVIDLGCGHGLLGLYAMQEGAKQTVFADFNIEVLNMVTKKNLELNFGFEKINKKVAFLSGDWENLPEKMKQKQNDIEVDENFSKNTSYPEIFDVLLMSEVIYNQDNYQKIVNLCKNIMNPNGGICILANKLFYFGCGGSMPEFTEFLEKNYAEIFEFETLEFINNKKGNKREIFGIRRRQ
ncbi:hypothetical protein PPERSA_01307 [Pseudocohnilembus persalinus]|uniref:protein-histidine N-methyltransferase n=1 Tax=Pseudocohnilembus persalinus TaxID=266149 RepID=A0A0V0QGX2_PSEPJ|nr:hypothetical protein PPERSA_01307 [Pseudocohnilembus persalinus]|eukprot:KRX01404.1 hypothetical protein PPERSA_01307 [Pseudocohnilembus persalinus]